MRHAERRDIDDNREISKRIWYDTHKEHDSASMVTLRERNNEVLGFHWFELLIIAGIGLILLGPKTVQSIARNAGKGVSQAKNVKDQVLAEVPEEVTQLSQHISRIPLSPQQAVQMLMTPEKETKSNSKSRSSKPKPKEDTTPSA